LEDKPAQALIAGFFMYMEGYKMELSPIYKRDLAEATQRGVLIERRMTVENFLTIKFGSLDPELVAIIQPIVDLAPSEYLNLLFQSANLSREDLLARFSSVS
jgi:hypothetical protein